MLENDRRTFTDPTYFNSYQLTSKNSPSFIKSINVFNNNFVVVGDSGGNVEALQVDQENQPQMIHKRQIHNSLVTCIDYEPQRQFIVTSSEDGNIYLSSLDGLKEQTKIT